MKILHVLEAIMGGTALHVRLLAEAQARAGANVVVAAPKTRSDGLSDLTFWEKLEGTGVIPKPIPFHKVPIHPRNVAAARELERLIREWRPDVVHSHSLTAGALARPIARRSRIATVHTPNGVRFAADRVGFGWLAEYALERLMAPLTDRVVAIGESERTILRRAYASEAIVIVPSGIPAPTVPPPPLPRPCRVVAVSRLASEKRPEATVRIMAMLRQRHPEVETVIIGDGPHARRIEALIAEIDPAIRLIRQGVAGVDAIADATALLITSRRESGPYVAIEAMALSRPVVAANAPGCRDIVVHEKTGYLYPPDSFNACVDYLSSFVEDPQHAEEMGDAGLRRMLSRYTIERTRDGIDDVYRQIVRTN